MKKTISFLLCVMLAVCALIPQAAFAQAKEKKTVRVGWYESAFHRTDQFGRKSGYGYEYQQRIATFTGSTLYNIKCTKACNLNRITFFQRFGNNFNCSSNNFARFNFGNTCSCSYSVNILSFIH